MTHDHTRSRSAGRGLASRGYEAVTAVSMTVGRGAAARTIADVAEQLSIVVDEAS